MNRQQIVATLLAMADLMELGSGNPFRARSFRSGARALDELGEDLEDLIREGRLVEVRGIGQALAREIEELHRDGESQRLRDLLDEVPPGVRRMLDLPGLGPRKVRALWKELGVADLGALAAACDEGRVAQLTGFGGKSQARIRQGVDFILAGAGRSMLPEAEAWADIITEQLRAAAPVERIEAAGAIRRRCELVDRIVLVVSSPAPSEVIACAARCDGVAAVISGDGDSSLLARLESGLEARVAAVSPDRWGAALLHETGAEAHIALLRDRARRMGLDLTPAGLAPAGSAGSAGSAAPLECREEEAVYRALALPLIPPELREGVAEIEMAESGRLPTLVAEEDIRGLVHVHTTYSDGRLTLAEMVEAARSRGFAYLGVADHSQSAFYAGGLHEADVIRQHFEIDRLNETLEGLRIFKGIESDIRPDGSLDYPPEVLDRFDFVIASVHSSMGQPRREMTTRLIRALRDPHTTFLGHPTGRLLLERPEMAIDMEAVLRAAAEEGVAVEINANPRRLDLDWRHGPLAAELGLPVGIHPDAHSAGGIDDTRYGVGIARKAGIDVSRVVNARSAEGFAEFIARRKS